MSFSYDNQLPTDADWVHYLVGDISETGYQISDEEIMAVLADCAAQHGAGTWNRYFAAAQVLEALLGRWQSKGQGVVEEQVGRLRIRRGVAGGAEAVAARIELLRAEGARRLLPRRRLFAMG